MVISNLMKPLDQAHFDAKLEELSKLIIAMRGEFFDALYDAGKETDELAKDVTSLRSDLVALIQRLDDNEDYGGEIADLDKGLDELHKELG